MSEPYEPEERYRVVIYYQDAPPLVIGQGMKLNEACWRRLEEERDRTVGKVRVEKEEQCPGE